MKKYLIAICFLCLSPAFGMGKKDMISMLNKLNQGVVNIETTIVYSAAYRNAGITGGTGFLITQPLPAEAGRLELQTGSL